MSIYSGKKTGGLILPVFLLTAMLTGGCVFEKVERPRAVGRELLKVTHVFDVESIGLSNSVKVRYAGFRGPQKPKVGQVQTPEYTEAFELHREMLLGARVYLQLPTGVSPPGEWWKPKPAYVWLQRASIEIPGMYEDILVNAELLRRGIGEFVPGEVPDPEIRELMKNALGKSGRAAKKEGAK
ncbi:MAG: hypothetical protein ACYS8W_14865 [Planctomycetota bacterium]|jgi:hypothetical protein